MNLVVATAEHVNAQADTLVASGSKDCGCCGCKEHFYDEMYTRRDPNSNSFEGMPHQARGGGAMHGSSGSASGTLVFNDKSGFNWQGYHKEFLRRVSAQ